MEEKGFRCRFCFWGVFLLWVFPADAQLAPAETRIMLQIQSFLEYPSGLQPWNKWTDFCSLPPSPSLTILCSDHHIVELSIVGNRSSSSSATPLSERFSFDSFLTVLTKLWSLQKLSLVSLGIWGTLPAKITRFKSLESLNMSSNLINGEIPQSVSTFPRLKSLVLSENQFNGTVPDLSGLIFLQELDLRSNNLGPDFPSLPRGMVKVSLGNNSFRSNIPQDFRKLNDLQVLDLSLNKLIGPVPSFLFSLPSVEYINLGKNHFSGELDPNVTCSRNLSFVDISSNFLTGKLPSCLERNRTVISVWNCLSNSTAKYQRHSGFCETGAIAVQPPDRSQKRGSSAVSTMKLGIVLSIIGGIVVVSVLLGLSMLFLWRRVHDQKDDSFVIKKVPATSSRFGRHVPQSMRMVSTTLPAYNHFTIKEIEDATNSFDAPNLLVSVLGQCIATYPNMAGTVFIVLEYVTDASLRDHLNDWRKRDLLKWPQRMSITMGIARGLQYLHSGGIIGNGLKLDNILLDENLNPKIRSYNISLPPTVGAEIPPSNTPEISNTHRNPEKEDIYQLGVILVEVITGRPTTSQNEIDDLHFQLERSIAESPSTLRDLVDPSIRGTFAYESLKTVAQITINCLTKDPTARPTVEDVLWHMQYSVQVQEGWGSSGNLSGTLSGNLSGSFGNKML